MWILPDHRFHGPCPSSGFLAYEALNSSLAEHRSEAATCRSVAPRDRIAWALLGLVSLPLRIAHAGIVALIVGWLAAVVIQHTTSVDVSALLWSAIHGRSGSELVVLRWGVLALFFTFFLAVPLTFIAIWAVSQGMHEPVAATISRQAFGPPDQVLPMGTWSAPLSRHEFLKKQMHVHLHVFATVGSTRWLVMARSHWSLVSARVALFPTPAEQVPGLLDAIAAYREIAATE